MLKHAFEGFWENGQFHPLEQPVKSPEKLRAILTVLDEPYQKKVIHTSEYRLSWLNELKKMIIESTDEDLPDLLSRQMMHPPHGLTDE